MYINKISQKLDELGMSRKLKGYYYIRSAISDIIRLEYIPDIKTIYIKAAEIHLTNFSNIERNIRYAIEKTWEIGNTEMIYKTFGYTINAEKGKPTNSEFLFLLADNIKYSE